MLSRDDLRTKTNAELIAIFNERRLEMEADLRSWKRSKELLIDRILGKAPFEATTEELSEQKDRPTTVVEEAVVEVAKPKKGKAKVKKAVATREKRTGEIRAYAEEMLLVAKGTDEKSRRPLGLTYLDILGKVLKKFPEARTTLNCLRWYAAKMNKQGRPGGRDGPKITMPARPVSREAEAA